MRRRAQVQGLDWSAVRGTLYRNNITLRSLEQLAALAEDPPAVLLLNEDEEEFLKSLVVVLRHLGHSSLSESLRAWLSLPPSVPPAEVEP